MPQYSKRNEDSDRFEIMTPKYSCAAQIMRLKGKKSCIHNQRQRCTMLFSKFLVTITLCSILPSVHSFSSHSTTTTTATTFTNDVRFHATRSDLGSSLESSEQHIMEGQGFSSIHITHNTLIPDSCNDKPHPTMSLYGGSKRGNVFRFDLVRQNASGNKVNKSNDDDGDDGQSFTPKYTSKFTVLKDDKHIFKQYPIYSMGSYYDKDRQLLGLACGGGDRFVTVWENDCNYKDDFMEKSISGNDIQNWKVTSTLGPHTGWIKDLVIEPPPSPQQGSKYQDRKIRMHSIGCNCIETWVYCTTKDSTTSSIDNSIQDNNEISDHNTWKHYMKRTVDSCPLTGATLSSDLLCLCLDIRNENDCLLYSGGVDGRIHQWHGDSGTPIVSFPAHDGRVNALVMANEAQFLISSGHDGIIKCWDVSKHTCFGGVVGDPTEEKSFRTVDVKDRILAMTCIRESENHADMIVGTASGVLFSISAFRKEDGSISMNMNQRYNMQQLSESSSSTSINALAVVAPLEDDLSEVDIIVAHANGLTIIPWKFNAKQTDIITSK